MSGRNQPDANIAHSKESRIQQVLREINASMDDLEQSLDVLFGRLDVASNRVPRNEDVEKTLKEAASCELVGVLNDINNRIIHQMDRVCRQRDELEI